MNTNAAEELKPFYQWDLFYYQLWLYNQQLTRRIFLASKNTNPEPPPLDLTELKEQLPEEVNNLIELMEVVVQKAMKQMNDALQAEGEELTLEMFDENLDKVYEDLRRLSVRFDPAWN